MKVSVSRVFVTIVPVLDPSCCYRCHVIVVVGVRVVHTRCELLFLHRCVVVARVWSGNNR